MSQATCKIIAVVVAALLILPVLSTALHGMFGDAAEQIEAVERP